MRPTLWIDEIYFVIYRVMPESTRNEASMRHPLVGMDNKPRSTFLLDDRNEGLFISLVGSKVPPITTVAQAKYPRPIYATAVIPLICNFCVIMFCFPWNVSSRHSAVVTFTLACNAWFVYQNWLQVGPNGWMAWPDLTICVHTFLPTLNQSATIACSQWFALRFPQRKSTPILEFRWALDHNSRVDWCLCNGKSACFRERTLSFDILFSDNGGRAERNSPFLLYFYALAMSSPHSPQSGWYIIIIIK